MPISTPALVNSATNTLTIGVVTTLIVVTLAFIYAYALTPEQVLALATPPGEKGMDRRSPLDRLWRGDAPAR